MSSSSSAGQLQAKGASSWLQRPLVFWAVAVTASVQFAITYVNTLLPEFDFDRYAYAGVEYPYRRRVLMQWVLRAALRLGDRLTYTSHHSKWGPIAVCSLAIATVSTLASVAVASQWIRHIAGARSPLRWFALLVVWVCNYHFLLIPEIRFQLPYDLPSMAFFGLGCYAAYTRNRVLYYATLIVGTVNRESTLFLPFVFLLSNIEDASPMPGALRRVKPALWAETLLQLGLWAIVVGWCIRVSGGSGPGPQLLAANVRMIVKPVHWPTYASILGFLWIPYVALFRRIADVRLQRIAWLAPPWAVVMLVFADPLEIRTHSEWAVYMAVCIACIARNTLAGASPMPARSAQT